MSLQILRSMTSSGAVCVICIVFAAIAGCDQILMETGDKPETPLSNNESSPPRGGFLDESQDAPAAAETNPAQPSAAPANSDAANPPANNNAASLPANTNQPAIRLSAGVALAQTLPNGTGMSFSVDYQFQNGQPDPSNKYVWVIQRGDGRSLGQPVQLAREGTLPLIVPGLRPETGPFKSHILEVTPAESQRKISNSISLR